MVKSDKKTISLGLKKLFPYILGDKIKNKVPIKAILEFKNLLNKSL